MNEQEHLGHSARTREIHNGSVAMPKMSDEKKRRDQLLAAPQAVEADAAPRIRVTKRDSVTRIDILDDASVRPGGADPGES
jgi:hypothetical protein